MEGEMVGMMEFGLGFCFCNRDANNALDQLERCACKNGGELIKITDHTSSNTVTTGAVLFSGLISIYNKDSPKKAKKDKIYAEIYIKKNESEGKK